MQADPVPRLSGRIERVLALRTFPGLAKVDPSHLAVLADVARERVFTEGAALLSPGEPVRAMHLIRRGEVAVLKGGVATRRYRAGDIVGAIASLTRDPTGQHVVALGDVRTFEIDRDDFTDVLEESFSLLQAALQGMMRAALHARHEIPVDAGFSAPVSDAMRPATDLGLVERALFVRRLLTFGKAPVEALAELARDMASVRAPAGQVLWQLGDAAPHSLLLYSGVVLCETSRGQTFRFGPDSVVGGIDSIAGEPRWYRAVAEAPIVALRSEVHHLLDAIEDHPDLGLDMLRSAARILTELYDRIDRLTLAGR